jgi:hypothetical protein
MSYSPFEPQLIEAYTTTQSVRAGERIDFSVSVHHPVAGDAKLEVYRFDQIVADSSHYGNAADHVYQQDFRGFLGVATGERPIHVVTFRPPSLPLPANASQDGCNWRPGVSVVVPPRTRTGIYFARFTYGGYSTYVMFVVRPRRASRNRIVCQTSTSTHQAYNAFGGYALYGQPISRAIKNPVSFERPCQLWDYILYEAPILLWFDRNFSVDFCTNYDLHRGVLSDYDLFVSCGHDEYWTRQMRDSVDAFGRAGGNVLFLSGNTCYRPMAFEGPNDSQIRRTSLESGDSGRPEALTTGVNWSAGRWTKPLIRRGFVVQNPNHWAFASTGLRKGDPFGDVAGVIGYETDAACYDHEGQPAPPTPPNFETLATANLPEWDDWYGRSATIGMFYRESRGAVVTASTTGWGRGLLSDEGPIHQVTHNLVRRLMNRL